MRRILLAIALLVAPLTTHAHGPVASGFSGGGGGGTVAATRIADGSVTNEEFQRINTLSSNAQTQLNGKLSTADSLLASEVVLTGSDSTVATNSDITMSSGSTQVFNAGSTLTVNGKLNATPTATDSKLNLSALVPVAAGSSLGLTIPTHATDCEQYATGLGQLCYKNTGVLFIGNGAWAEPVFGRAGAVWKSKWAGDQYGTSLNGWNTGGSGTYTSVYTAATAANPHGYMAFTNTSNGAADRHYLMLSSIANSLFYGAAGQAIFDIRLMLPVLPTSAFNLKCGFTSLPTSMGSSTTGVWFQADDTGGAFWRVSTGAGTMTPQTTTTALTAGVPARLTIVMNPDWTRASFFVNGVLATGITNPVVTSGLGTTMSASCTLLNTSAATPSVSIDYAEFSYVLTSPPSP